MSKETTAYHALTLLPVDVIRQSHSVTCRNGSETISDTPAAVVVVAFTTAPLYLYSSPVGFKS